MSNFVQALQQIGKIQDQGFMTREGNEWNNPEQNSAISAQTTVLYKPYLVKVIKPESRDYVMLQIGKSCMSSLRQFFSTEKQIRNFGERQIKKFDFSASNDAQFYAIGKRNMSFLDRIFTSKQNVIAFGKDLVNQYKGKLISVEDGSPWQVRVTGNSPQIEIELVNTNLLRVQEAIQIGINDKEKAYDLAKNSLQELPDKLSNGILPEKVLASLKANLEAEKIKGFQKSFEKKVPSMPLNMIEEIYQDIEKIRQNNDQLIITAKELEDYHLAANNTIDTILRQIEPCLKQKISLTDIPLKWKEQILCRLFEDKIIEPYFPKRLDLLDTNILDAVKLQDAQRKVEDILTCLKDYVYKGKYRELSLSEFLKKVDLPEEILLFTFYELEKLIGIAKEIGLNQDSKKESQKPRNSIYLTAPEIASNLKGKEKAENQA